LFLEYLFQIPRGILTLIHSLSKESTKNHRSSFPDTENQTMDITVCTAAILWLTEDYAAHIGSEHEQTAQAKLRDSYPIAHRFFAYYNRRPCSHHQSKLKKPLSMLKQ